MSLDQRPQNMKLNRLHISIYIKQAKQHISTNAIVCDSIQVQGQRTENSA